MSNNTNCQQQAIAEKLAQRGLTDEQRYWQNHAHVGIVVKGWNGPAADIEELNDYMAKFFEDRGCEVVEISFGGNLTGSVRDGS